jgi:hypothetical protein
LQFVAFDFDEIIFLSAGGDRSKVPATNSGNIFLQAFLEIAVAQPETLNLRAVSQTYCARLERLGS